MLKSNALFVHFQAGFKSKSGGFSWHALRSYHSYPRLDLYLAIMEILYRRPICHGTLYLSESAVKKKNENICKYFQQSQPHICGSPKHIVGHIVHTVGRLSTSSSFHRKAWEAVPPKLPFTLFKCEHRVEKAIVRLGGWKHNLPNKPYNLQCRGLPFLGQIK